MERFERYIELLREEYLAVRAELKPDDEKRIDEDVVGDSGAIELPASETN